MKSMLLGALALLLVAPSAAAQLDVDRCAEPCGYIVPIIDLDFPDKLACGGSGLVFTSQERSDCMPVPALGESKRLDGTLTWYYDASEEPPYPKEAGKDIVISFDGTRNNPSWLEMVVEPTELHIDDATLSSPSNFHPEENSAGGTTLWYRFQVPVSVTFTRTGDPGASDLERIDNRDGVIQVFLKAKSTESSTTYRESFGVEEFRFYAYDGEGALQAAGDAPAEDAPGPALPLLALGALALAAVRRRRDA